MAINRRRFITQGVRGVASMIFGRNLLSPHSNQLVQWMWSGALTTSSIQVKSKLWTNGENVRLVASVQTDLSQPIFSDAVSANSNNERIAALHLTNLQPGTQYYYAVEVDGVLDVKRGRFRTPTAGAYSFTVCFASCARTNSTSQVFRRIAEVDPLLFIHLGDMHYENIAVNNPAIFHAAFDTVLASNAQSPLYENVPVAYIWDDHDYGPNNSDSLSPSRTASRMAYQQAVPHHALAAGAGNVPIYRAFTIGRVRFILTDTRSERDANSVHYQDPNKTMLGAAQKAWLKQELLAAQNSHAAIVWACSVPWLADFPNIEDDKWNAFEVERRELANFIQDNQIDKLFYIAGDVHMLAADDGRNNLYADGATSGFPVFQAAALDQSGSTLPSNTYSEGQWPREHQFGQINIMDNGGLGVEIEYIGRNIWFGDRINLKLTSPYNLNKQFLPIISG